MKSSTGCVHPHFTWNPDRNKLACAIKGLPGFAHIQAKLDDDGNIVMRYKSPIPDPLRLITFFPADAGGWNWKLELSSDEAQTGPRYTVSRPPAARINPEIAFELSHVVEMPEELP